MMKGKNGQSARDCRSRRRWTVHETYIEEMSGLIMRELYEEGGCSALQDIADTSYDKLMYSDIKAIALAATKLSEQLRRSESRQADREAACQRAITEQQRTVELIRAECERRVQQVRTEHERILADAERIRAEAVGIRHQAEMDAQRTRAEAAAEKRVLLSNVNALIEQDRAQCMEDARRAAEEERQKLIEKYRLEAIEVYNDMRDNFTPNAIREAIDSYRREDSSVQAAAEARNHRAVTAFEDARTAYSAEMTRMQAQMTQQLSEMQNRLSRSMMDWREQLYRLETMDLAQCAVNLSTILSGVDKRVGDAALQGDSRLAEGLSAVRRNLARFEKQFRNALTCVGLEVYQPQPGDDFDPARHVLSEAEKDADPDQPLTITGCIRPGVLGSSGSSCEALIRSEVAAREKEVPPQIFVQPEVLPQPFVREPEVPQQRFVREPETPAQPFRSEQEAPSQPVRPLFNQIIPGGDMT